MHVETTHFYEAVRKEFPFTDMVQTSIPSLGTFYDKLRVPDLLLTARWHLDSKGNLFNDPRFLRFTFQTDGRSDAELNLPHFTLMPEIIYKVCRFKVAMDIVFGAGVTNKVGGNIGANLGVEKVVKGGLDATVEASRESPGTKTVMHAVITGILSARERKLDVWGEMQGMAKFNVSY